MDVVQRGLHKGYPVMLSIYLSIYPIVLGTVGAPHDLPTNIRHSSRSLCSPHGVARFQTRPILDVIFPSFSLSAFHSPFLYSTLEDCLGKSRSSCDMPIPLHFVSFYSGLVFFIGSNGFPNPASHLFVGDICNDVVGVYNATCGRCLR